MPLKVRKFNAQVKDPQSGQMVPAGLLSSDSLQAIDAAETAAIAEIQQKGAETKASIPDNYTELSESVDELKESITDVENDVYTWEEKILPLVEDGVVDATSGLPSYSATSKYTKFTCSGYKMIEFTSSAYISNYGYVFIANDEVIEGKKTTVDGRIRIFVPEGAVQFRVCWKNTVDQHIYVATLASEKENAETIAYINGKMQTQDITDINKNAVYNAKTVGNTIDETPTTTSENYGSQIIEVHKGDSFIVNGKGATTYVLWAFTDKNRVILECEATAYTATDKKIIAPADGYLYFQPNITQSYSIVKEVWGGYYRKRITIISTDSAQTLYDKFVEAYHDGNCDVYIQNAVYTLTNSLMESLISAYDGIPIGRNCNYYFESGAKIIANYTGSNTEVHNTFSVLSSNREGGDYYIENANIEGKNIEYIIHDESNGSVQPTHRIYKNCVLSIDNTALGTDSRDLSKCIGGGLGVYTTIEIENCIFNTINLNPSYMGADVSYHGPNNKAFSDSHIYIKDSYFGNTFRAAKLSENTSAPYPVILLSNNSMGSSPVSAQEFTLNEWNNVIRT